MAIQFLYSTNDPYIQNVLLFFMSKHVIFIKPENIPFLTNAIFNVQLNDDSDNDTFAIIHKLSLAEIDFFEYSYNFVIGILNNRDLSEMHIIVNRGTTLLDLHVVALKFLSELISCYSDSITINIYHETITLCDSLSQNNHINLLLNVFLVCDALLKNCECFDDINIVITIIFRIIFACCIPHLICNCLSLLIQISSHDLSLKIHILNHLLEKEFFNFFMTCNNALIIKIFFEAVSYCLPEGRLFPESKYLFLHDLIHQSLESNDCEVSIAGSCLAVKLYLIDQILYRDLIQNALMFILFSYQKTTDNIIIYAFDIFLTYLKCFRDEGLLFLQTIDYYNKFFSDFIEEVEPSKYHIKFPLLLDFSGFLFKYGNELISEPIKINYVNAIFRSGFICHQYNAIVCMSKFIYLLKSPKFFEEIYKLYFHILKASFDNSNTDSILLLIDFLESIVNPSHVMSNKVIPEYNKISLLFLESFAKLIDQAIRVYSKFLNVFFHLFIRANEILTYYNHPLVHSFYDFSVNYVLQIAINPKNEKDASKIWYYCSRLISLFNCMINNHFASDEEILKMFKVYQIILNIDQITQKHSLSNICVMFESLLQIALHYSIEIISPFFEVSIKKFGVLDTNEIYLRPILSTLLIAIFAKLPGKFDTAFMFPIVDNILSYYQFDGCNSSGDFLLMTLVFLQNYQELITPEILRKSLRIFIIYLSYLKNAPIFFNVKKAVHQQVIQYVKNNLLKMSNWEELFNSCFLSAPSTKHIVFSIITN
ncbi:hypothetical protein TRFO_22765 [Tritrichomonas foetus]|uniref:Uncharacterized protein n=1 Tax=Tritrichomonas foetus TaxID=1144522 RepID=A0A1J4KCH2_9EUKA|nr:hypothetical protein TRFO_22765 [Tritrichomonas foetus]|eukprot:OHT08674.1 hypothetical protein TRFO_22765 [Tritrichomonas foetus]